MEKNNNLILVLLNILWKKILFYYRLLYCKIYLSINEIKKIGNFYKKVIINRWGNFKILSNCSNALKV